MSLGKGTAALLVDIARKEEGTVEGPKDNETKYGKFTGMDRFPWCGSFVMWCAHEAGVKVPNVVSTVAGASAFKKLKTWTDSAKAKPLPGDIVFFDFVQGGALIEHVGIVVKDNGDGTITTVEGNTSGPKKKNGSQANGGEVCVKIRAYKKNSKGLSIFVKGFGRPKYTA